MNQFKIRSLAAVVSGALLLSFGIGAKADSTEDIINALITKGVLTEEEGDLLKKGREGEKTGQEKAMKKAGKVSISDAIDRATIYGDMRVRHEWRNGEDTAGLQDERNRNRYKLTLGVKTESGDMYSDIALAMGGGGRSDNATFGSTSNGGNNKENVFVKRAMFGWKMTDWLTVEAGRIANPLYTTEMVWDKDLTMEGLAEKLTYKVGDTELFGNFVQSQYLGDYKNVTGASAANTPSHNGDRITNVLLAFQGGAKFKVTEDVTGKVALTYTKYTSDKADTTGVGFTPATRTFIPGLGATKNTITPALGTNIQATNNMSPIEIPFEVNFKTSSALGVKLFGDYVHNLDGHDRYKAAVAAAPAGATRNTISAAGNDDDAWMLGVGLESIKDKKPKAGDWSARLWYQDVGVYAVDPNTVDSDFMDSRVNMKGFVAKGEYLVKDNLFLNVAAGHATRKNNDLAAVGTGGDLRVNLDSFNLYQVDMTYKF